MQNPVGSFSIQRCPFKTISVHSGARQELNYRIGTGKCVQISVQVSMCGEASLKQGGNVHLGLSCLKGRLGQVYGVWQDMVGRVALGHPKN